VDDPADALAFAGKALTHTDWMPDNILISHGRGWLVDWAWATPGAGWTDPAFWLLRLIAHGHTIEQAEAYAARLPAYAAADPAHINIFARANVNMERNREAKPDPVGQDDGPHRPHLGTASADRTELDDRKPAPTRFSADVRSTSNPGTRQPHPPETQGT
jgi:hypothetical protein